MSEFTPFFFLQKFFKLYAILTRYQEYITWLVIHQTKPEFVGIHHAKGLRDRSTYKGETRHIKIYTNFWIPCSMTAQLRHNLISDPVVDLAAKTIFSSREFKGNKEMAVSAILLTRERFARCSKFH